MKSKKKNAKNDFVHFSPQDLDKRIVELKELMKEAVSELEFEHAAKYRDEIKQLNEMRILL